MPGLERRDPAGEPRNMGLSTLLRALSSALSCVDRWEASAPATSTLAHLPVVVRTHYWLLGSERSAWRGKNSPAFEIPLSSGWMLAGVLLKSVETPLSSGWLERAAPLLGARGVCGKRLGVSAKQHTGIKPVSLHQLQRSNREADTAPASSAAGCLVEEDDLWAIADVDPAVGDSSFRRDACKRALSHPDQGASLGTTKARSLAEHS